MVERERPGGGEFGLELELEAGGGERTERARDEDDVRRDEWLNGGGVGVGAATGAEGGGVGGEKNHSEPD